jgi:hypothetical protein
VPGLHLWVIGTRLPSDHGEDPCPAFRARGGADGAAPATPRLPP